MVMVVVIILFIFFFLKGTPEAINSQQASIGVADQEMMQG